MEITPEAHNQKPVDSAEPYFDWCAASCGISTAYGLPELASNFVKQIAGRTATNKGKNREAFILFSDINYTKSRYAPGPGERISSYIKAREEDLGPIWETETRRNPNTNNWITIWIWAPKYENIAKGTFR